MKLRSRNNWRMLLSAALVVSLTTQAAWAAKQDFSFRFPGVDSGGNLNSSLGTNDKVKVTLNTSTGRFTAHGAAKVQNHSRSAHTYNNVPLNIPDATIQQSKYEVKRSGRAIADASGTISL